MKRVFSVAVAVVDSALLLVLAVLVLRDVPAFQPIGGPFSFFSLCAGATWLVCCWALAYFLSGAQRARKNYQQLQTWMRDGYSMWIVSWFVILGVAGMFLIPKLFQVANVVYDTSPEQEHEVEFQRYKCTKSKHLSCRSYVSSWLRDGESVVINSDYFYIHGHLRTKGRQLIITTRSGALGRPYIADVKVKGVLGGGVSHK